MIKKKKSTVHSFVKKNASNVRLINALNEMRRKGASLLEQWEFLQKTNWAELQGNPDSIIDILPEWRADLTFVKLIYALLRDKDSLVRATAAENLGSLKDPRAIPYLIEALQDINYRVRRVIIQVLGELGTVEQVPYLLALLQEKDAEIRRTVVTALGHLRAFRVLPQIRKLLQDPNKSVRSEAIKVLGLLEDEESIPYLLTFLKDSDPEIQKMTITVLGSFGDVEVIPYLNKLSGETLDSELRQHILQVILKIKKKNTKTLLP